MSSYGSLSQCLWVSFAFKSYLCLNYPRSFKSWSSTRFPRKRLCIAVHTCISFTLVRISDILSWVRNYYLTHVILPMLSIVRCLLVVLELTRMAVKCCHCHAGSQRIRKLLGVLFKAQNAVFNGWQEKESIIRVRGGWIKIRPSGSPFVTTR